VSLVIKLVRHGESEANAGRLDPQEVGDHAIPLSPKGLEEAEATGRTIGAGFLRGALLYTSGYRRTRDTLGGILSGAGFGPDERAAMRHYDDPRLREVEHGYEPLEAQGALRETHGWFYYRFRGGESPADCYDRVSSFLESLMRQIERKRAEKALIVSHELAIRCFVMRFLHLTVEQFDEIANPDNCCVVTLADHTTLDAPAFRSGWWGVTGLTLRGARP